MPYRLIWDSVLVPGVYSLMGRVNDDRQRPTREEIEEYNRMDIYEVITKPDEFGVVTKHLIFDDTIRVDGDNLYNSDI